MKYKINKIIDMTFYDKDHNPVWVMDGDDTMSVSVKSESATFSEHAIKTGDHVYLTVNLKQGRTLMINGFYGGEEE